jgi:hypothetical protein
MQKGSRASGDLQQFMASCTNVTPRENAEKFTDSILINKQSTRACVSKAQCEQSAAVLSSGKRDSVRPAESTRRMESNILWPSSAARLARSRSLGRGKGAQHLSC